MHTTRQNRFQSFTPLRHTSTSLRRLKTAFSPVRSRSTSASSATSSVSVSTTSPLTLRTSSPADSQRSANSSSAGSIPQLLMVRRKPSVLDLQVQEERDVFGHELDMLEPRPWTGAGGMGGVEVGIFQVLEGKC
ncbi:hypothetical protein M011DRAFT_458006 [Sporormia fimetaria CBS 119925]|uniref:Uncharacterized protein n=1 Tax=Sporormia fimetaria CBS 119925 TaxID=1340428 RepID=A0A6A6VG68_9PLEO|nr:hypothetical protein M011DRAFT_458006 [Sporormia fimetaria CBS 119925]